MINIPYEGPIFRDTVNYKQKLWDAEKTIDELRAKITELEKAGAEAVMEIMRLKGIM